MKRNKILDLSERYLLYRMVPYFEPIDGSDFDPSTNTGLALKTAALVKPKAKFIRKRVLIVIQKISRIHCKNEFWIKDSLEKEARQLFEEFQPKEVIIRLDYE